AMVNQRILKISIKNFNSDVLVLLLNSFICKMQFERIGTTGGVQTNLSSIDMQNILIPKIDSTTQEKIAKYIQESFNLRKKSKQLLDNAKIKVEEQIQGKI
ncbi:restriction endonuclease subunit S, partial [Campylobacter jejuni]|nr:restriction endonuclease subunit S [Campylobacter jejuni]